MNDSHNCVCLFLFTNRRTVNILAHCLYSPYLAASLSAPLSLSVVCFMSSKFFVSCSQLCEKIADLQLCTNEFASNNIYKLSEIVFHKNRVTMHHSRLTSRRDRSEKFKFSWRS